tara:strand:+ start:3268 stop:3453 length:186 start_codon:yes stop_codon:yes gene_type:complete
MAGNYVGFKNLTAKLQKEGKTTEAAGAIAADIGRKKYGSNKFARAAAAGKKMKGMKPKSAY